MLKTLMVFGLSWVFFSACVSMSVMQSGRTLKKDEWSGHGAAGSVSAKYKEKSTDPISKEVQESVEEVSIPIIEFGGRYGVMPNMDLGLKYVTPGSLIFDGKYRSGNC